jgi:hypothetical protein
MNTFINYFTFRGTSLQNIEEAKLTINLMSEENIDRLQTELLDYIADLEQEMDDMPLQHSNTFNLDGILYETTKEYDELEDQKSKAQEILNIIALCVS